MTTYETINNKILVVKLKEVITVSEAMSFSTLINQIVSSKGFRYIIIDFQSVTIVSSAFLSALLSLKKILLDIGGEVVLTSLNNGVKRVLELAEIIELFRIFPTLEDGKDYFLKKV